MRNDKYSKENQVSKKINGLFFKIKSDKAETGKKLLPAFKYVFLALLFLIPLVLLFFQNSELNENGSREFWIALKNFFVFSNQSHFLSGPLSDDTTNLWVLSFGLIYITIKYTIVGTFIGFILATITAILSFNKTTNKYFAFLIKYFVLFLRAIPELVFIGLFAKIYSRGIGLFLIYVWFTWLWLHKYYIEILENTDLEAYYVSINQGNNKFKAFFKEIFPRVKNRFISLFLFSIEANMRWVSVLALLGVSGIGELIEFSRINPPGRFTELGVPILVLMMSISILEVLNILFKKYVFEVKSIKLKFDKKASKKEIYNKLSNKINWQKVITYFLFISISIYSIFVLTTTPIFKYNSSDAITFWNAFINPDFSSLNFKSMNFKENVLLMIFQSFAFSIITIFLIFLITILLIRWMSIRLNKTYISLLSRLLNTLVRLIPTIVYFFIFNPFFISPIFLLILIITIHEASSLIKQLTEAIDNLDEEVINNLRLQGFTNNKIFFRYALPSIKNDLISLLVFYFELVFRSSITYSVLAGDELALGHNIWKNMQSTPSGWHPETAMSYIWLATIAIIFINVSGVFINKVLNRRNKYIK
ncbi:ABC transporter permease subunit [Mycoplasma sp. Mirounga ES2805-ORL]|uniref:ABC transporter permease subunit n=1 Tax=Mycoplasma sp. Mirounga ES2805-ORL TaxID=754514 RepID=UPI00197C143E|nr:ABC transporter permease subunit [Mycoplasma sp. Mirounga ES2805-ORL]QSF13639.1 ABC transporter permease subunit [Mycoplasma sp. Mirounga ES2805-ORL]